MLFRFFAALILIATSPCLEPVLAAEGPTDKPAYFLKSGREFTYHTEATSKNGAGRQYIVDWKVWPVGRESDGSWRLVIRCDLTMKDATTPRPTEKETKDTLVWRCRMFNDGRLIGATTMGTVRDPFRLFPRLPDGAKELEAGWDSAGPEQEGVTQHHRLTPGTKPGDETISITTVSEGPQDKVYLSHHSMLATFDKKRGAVTRVETEDRSEHLNRGSSTKGIIELTSIEERGDEWAAKFGKEAEFYFDAVDAYEEAQRMAGRDAGRCAGLLADAKVGLEKTLKALTTTVFVDSIGSKIAAHDGFAKYLAREASERAERIDKVAEGWEAKGVDGKAHRLEDYRGKVVVMDFWYRNCGWCISAMPQVVQLSKSFHDQPVAVLGMCTDEKESDARAVIDAMGMTYPTIKAKGIAEKYGINGFPTLLVLDKRGIIREIHVGYSPRLFEDVSGIIRKLLAE